MYIFINWIYWTHLQFTIQFFIIAPEPHILLFRREKDYQKKYGNNLKPTTTNNNNNNNSIGGMAG